MKNVRIPFLPRFRLPMLNGIKTCTARPYKMGNRGDFISLFGAIFDIITVEKLTLLDVRDNYWKEEGLSSPREFEEVWNELHPYKGFVPDQEVFVHWFVRIK